MKKVNSILIIDDDPLFMLLIKKTILKYNFANTILAFNNGLEAFESLMQSINNSSELPDIILLDINMPIMDSWEFLDKFIPILQKINKKISIYIVTSSLAEIDKTKARTYPIIKDYLLKPIDQPILTTIIEAYYSTL